MHMQLLSFFG